MRDSRFQTADGVIHRLYDLWDMLVKLTCKDGARIMGSDDGHIVDDEQPITCLLCLAGLDESTPVTTCGNCGGEYEDPGGDADCPTCYP